MSRPTVASLSADLAATNKVLSTYIAQLNDAHRKIEDLQAQICALEAKRPGPNTPARSATSQNLAHWSERYASYGAFAEARKHAVAAYLAEHPSARIVPDATLVAKGYMQ